MSGKERESAAWKTVRVSDPAYSKLVELSGFMTLITGLRTMPMSTIADWAITSFYDESYQKLKETVSDSKRLEETRRKVALGLKRVYDAQDQWKLFLDEMEKAQKKYAENRSNRPNTE